MGTFVTLPEIQWASGATPAKINGLLSAVEGALDTLYSRTSSLSTKSAIIRHGVPLGSSTSGDTAQYADVGDLVYYDTADSCFKPAIAKLLGEPMSNGASVEAPEARVEGLIIAKDASGITGTMLCGGYYESNAVASACLGPTAIAGIYYLSPVTPGRAAADPGFSLRQPLISYYGDGKFSLNIFYMAHDNHFHGSASLSVGRCWQNGSEEPSEEKPPVADDSNISWTFVYNIDIEASDEDAQILAEEKNKLLGLGELTNKTTAIFYNGVLQPSDKFTIFNGRVWCALDEQPAADSVVLFNHYPFAYGSAVVRSVQSKSPSLVVETRNGIVELKSNVFVDGTTNKSATAVSSINENTVDYTPVVTEVTAGAGIDVAQSDAGRVIVSTKQLIGNKLDAYSINHNGTVVASDGIFQYIVFPAGRTSEFIMYLPVADAGVALKAGVWITTTTSSASGLKVAIYKIAEPDDDSPVQPLPTTDQASVPDGTFSGPGSSSSDTGSSYLYYMKSSEVLTDITGPVTLVARIYANQPSAPIRVMRAGFILSN